MAMPILHGPAFSTYVRSVRITLAEKGVDYDLREFNFLEGWPEGYEKLHPFMKVPAFEHDELTLYESPAIMVYINAGFDGPALLPDDPAMRAKVLQAVNVIDNYAYDALITALLSRARSYRCSEEPRMSRPSKTPKPIVSAPSRC